MNEALHAAEVLAQAKINLRLRILAREDTGFHQLETLFLRLELGDTVRVRRSANRTLEVGGDVDLSSLGPPERNLAWRAAVAYLDARGDTSGFAIEIDKHIPIGGGLGGGSADAGGVLRCLDALSPNPIGEARLLEIAARLGSDVPFLTSSNVYALAWGRGERMLALDPPAQRQVALVLPGVSVNTAQAYGWLAEARSSAVTSLEPLALDARSLSQWPTIASLATNDFEPVVAVRHGGVALLLAALREAESFEVVMMSGSGSTVFGLFTAASRNIASFGLGGAGLDAMEPRLTRTAGRVEPVRRID